MLGARHSSRTWQQSSGGAACALRTVACMLHPPRHIVPCRRTCKRRARSRGEHGHEARMHEAPMRRALDVPIAVGVGHAHQLVHHLRLKLAIHPLDRPAVARIATTMGSGSVRVSVCGTRTGAIHTASTMRRDLAGQMPPRDGRETASSCYACMQLLTPPSPLGRYRRCRWRRSRGRSVRGFRLTARSPPPRQGLRSPARAGSARATIWRCPPRRGSD